MKNEQLKRKHLVTTRLNDRDLHVLKFLSDKYHLSYSKILRTLLNSCFIELANFSRNENK